MIKINRKLIIPFMSIILIAGGTYLAIQLAKGYRPTREGLAGTGLLAATSLPKGAEVYINDRLTTATDDTINLPPGEYKVTIKKDGYVPWEKTLKIEQELVTQTNATLFRAVPSLSPLTLSGATNILPSPDGQKIAFAVASASAEVRNGLYVMELNGSNFSSQKAPRQIAKNVGSLDFANAKLLWSPNSSQLLVNFKIGETGERNYLLDISKLNEIDGLNDVSARLPLILSEWEEEIVVRETKQFTLLPEEVKRIATESATNVYFSPNEEKIMYTSTGYLQLPDKITDTPPATSTQKEERSLEPGGIYIYDLIEDKNFRVGEIELDEEVPGKELLLLTDYQPGTQNSSGTDSSSIATQSPAVFNRLQDSESIDRTILNFKAHYSSLFITGYQWYPNSNHVLILFEDRIDLLEYDATNWITVYSGLFQERFVYPWPDGSRLIILTNLNPSSTNNPANLYTVDIK